MRLAFLPLFLLLSSAQAVLQEQRKARPPSPGFEHRASYGSESDLQLLGALIIACAVALILLGLALLFGPGSEAPKRRADLRKYIGGEAV